MRLFEDRLLIECRLGEVGYDERLNVQVKLSYWIIEWPKDLATEALCEFNYN